MRNLHLIFVLATSLLPFATTQAAPADLRETGQATCYDATGATITCTGTGQDGDLKAGMAWPNPRFVAGPTADCVTDTLTGLMWVRAPIYAGYTWADAFTYANGLNLCGYTDWRLPNINELKSLVNSEAANPATFLNSQGFSGLQPAPYWSSTTHVGNPTVLAWYVSMGEGRVDGADKSIAGAFALPVRAGQ
jgi:hypothetical protein